MKFKTLIMEKKDSVCTIYINRPEYLNAANIEFLEELAEAVRSVSEDREIRVMILTGKGRGFSAGADKELLQHLIDFENSSDFRGFLKNEIQRYVNLLEQMEKPVIAAVNGPAAGGGVELALACDFRIASEEARFIFTEVTLGIIPDAGGIPRLTRILGCGKAKEIILTGQIIDGREAERIGLANKCVPHNQLLEEANRLAHRLAANAPLAVGAAKRMIDQTMDVDLMTGLDMVGQLQRELFKTQDCLEGVKALNEKRKPVFKGC